METIKITNAIGIEISFKFVKNERINNVAQKPIKSINSNTANRGIKWLIKIPINNQTTINKKTR
jgi:hypothetical protein